jgi:hypothetical protein
MSLTWGGSDAAEVASQTSSRAWRNRLIHWRNRIGVFDRPRVVLMLVQKYRARVT